MATSWQIGCSYRIETNVTVPCTPDALRDSDVRRPDGTRVHTLTDLPFDTQITITVTGISSTGRLGTRSAPRYPTTDPAAVRLVALEITQGLQNWQGDITLVKGKPTVVRAFLEPASGTEAQVDVRLQAVVNGQIVATAAPRNPDVQVVPPIDYNEYLFTARPGAAARAVLGASANFLLDLDAPGTRQEWVGSPSGQPNPSLPGSSHSVTYRLVVDDGVICAAAAAQTDSSAAPGTACRADLEFRFVKTPTVRMVGITAAGIQPTSTDLEEQALRILSVMPIPDLDYDLVQHNHPYAAPPSLAAPDSGATNAVLSRLLLTRATDASTRAYLGVLLGSPPPMSSAGRAIGILGNVAAWYTSGTEAPEAFGYARNRGVHEFGHVIGLLHTKDNNGSIICDRRVSAWDPPPPDAEYPKYPYMETSDPYRALLGPAGANADEQVWGFDTRFVDSDSADAAKIDALAVINPSNVYALMSYCSDGEGQARWVDMRYHGLFIDAINSINWEVGPLAGSDANPGPMPSHPIFSGYTTSPADGSAARGVLLPVFVVDHVVGAPEPAEGGYVLELLDSVGEVLRSVSFGAQVAVADISETGETGAEFEAWAVSVPDAPDYAHVRVRRRSQSGVFLVVAEATSSAAAPSVVVTSPTQGQVLSGATVQITWTAADGDGDALSYLVQYSTDGGATYETLAADHRSTSLAVPRRQLAGSTTAKVRVVASDGVRTASAVSDLFAVDPNPPDVRIDSPAEEAIYGGLQPLALQASAYDREDGKLGSPAVSWSSSIDGALGVGAHLVIDAGQLTPGTHVLTATATDSSNMVASASVAVTVKAGNNPPAAADDIAYGRRGQTVRVDVATNDSDTETDINLSSLRVAVPASEGLAEPGGGAMSFWTVAAGYDAFIYRVCDRASQCAAAEVTIIALGDW